jgi:hypothetical protein
MADLLTHVLVPYVLLTAASWRFDRLARRWIVIGMAGAAIPDLVKIGILVDDRMIESLLGVPFSYAPISSLGGVLLIAGTIALFFGRERRQVYALLVFGSLTALVVDGLRVFADGHSGFWLYPIWWRPPTPSLYVTADVRVLVVALLASTGMFLCDRYVVAPSGDR